MPTSPALFASQDDLQLAPVAGNVKPTTQASTDHVIIACGFVYISRLLVVLVQTGHWSAARLPLEFVAAVGCCVFGRGGERV